MLTHTCPSCGVFMQATDEDTLAWGIRTHTCEGASPFAGIILASDRERDELECNVVCWLLGAYREPFVWFREGKRPLMVT